MSNLTEQQIEDLFKGAPEGYNYNRPEQGIGTKIGLWLKMVTRNNGQINGLVLTIKLHTQYLKMEQSSDQSHWK